MLMGHDPREGNMKSTTRQPSMPTPVPMDRTPESTIKFEVTRHSIGVDLSKSVTQQRLISTHRLHPPGNGGLWLVADAVEAQLSMDFAISWIASWPGELTRLVQSPCGCIVRESLPWPGAVQDRAWAQRAESGTRRIRAGTRDRADLAGGKRVAVVPPWGPRWSGWSRGG
ncbi:hypothetical protein TPAR_00304 [Tolypocladium paradoxum]|uniref:Uncharacterized protein n=1 Tax=Tolypocladium paradoxum TaxID=94208 RepID=A0A2S4LAP2_9HYPO|nr:hypothetical protein TPAR_00304 [Tolypocladium paradoxum]